MMGTTLILNSNMAPIRWLPRLKTFTWQEAVKRVCSREFVTVHEHEDWVLRSPSTTMAVPSVIMATSYHPQPLYSAYSPKLIKLRDGYTCQYCNQLFSCDELTMDHVVPVSHGGKESWENIVAACAPCNHSRGNNTRIQPMTKPWKPTTFQLIALKKKEVITVPDLSWVPYIDWDPDLVRVSRPLILTT